MLSVSALLPEHTPVGIGVASQRPLKPRLVLLRPELLPPPVFSPGRVLGLCAPGGQ